MTKARGAADSIGKAGRGASFLLPAFSPYYVPYFPLFLRSHHTHPNHVNVHTYIHMHHPRSLSFLSSPSSPSIPRPILLCRSPSPHRFTAFVLLVTIVHMCTCVCVCTCIRASSQSSREVSCRAALRSRGERAALYVGERENVF